MNKRREKKRKTFSSNKTFKKKEKKFPVVDDVHVAAAEI